MGDHKIDGRLFLCTKCQMYYNLIPRLRFFFLRRISAIS